MTEMAVAAGIPAVQLRYKGSDDCKFLLLAQALREITRDTRTKLIINDRVDIALSSGADGVHFGQRDLAPQTARALMGEAMIIGLSTHNLFQVKRAQDEPIDYIGFGPIYKTLTKNDHDPVTGVELLKAAVASSRLPVVAIGGITGERIAELARIPWRNIACIGTVASAADPEAMMWAIQSESCHDR